MNASGTALKHGLVCLYYSALPFLWGTWWARDFNRVDRFSGAVSFFVCRSHARHFTIQNFFRPDSFLAYRIPRHFGRVSLQLSSAEYPLRSCGPATRHGRSARNDPADPDVVSTTAPRKLVRPRCLAPHRRRG